MSLTFEYIDNIDTSLLNLDDQEGIPQLPNCSRNYILKNTGKNSLDNCNEAMASIASVNKVGIRHSQPFKKPTNDVSTPGSCNGSDFDTECDSNEVDSDEENLLTVEEARQSQENYIAVMRKAYYLVRAVKDSKYRTPSSSLGLFYKLEQIIQSNKRESEDDDLFSP